MEMVELMNARSGFLENIRKKITPKKKLEKEDKFSLDPHRRQEYQQNTSAGSRDVNAAAAAAGGDGGDHHQYRHLLLHHLLSKQPTEQQQQEFQYHFPSIPQQQQQEKEENLIGSQQLLSFEQNQDLTQLIPATRTQIQQRPIRKRALNGQGSGGSGRRAPGRGSDGGAGEIVEVEGGHIIRSTGRKDRHSKVCTAKGPRDRRVRLSAHTAIQFYDVQDRLGYDRPSKAVDWLINKAKSAIDELDELPPWKPMATADDAKIPVGESAGVYVGNNDESSSLLPPPSTMDSDSIPDTINVTAAAPAVQFQSYLGGDSNLSQDLKLSLQSFQDPMIIQSNRNQEEEPHPSQLGFYNPIGWDETQPPDLARFNRLIGWNLAGAGSASGGGGGFMLIPPQPQPPPMLFGQAATQFFTQRGTLQSNNTPLVRACINGENSVNYQDHHQAVSVHPVSFSGIGFASSSGGFSGFRIPARIQGDHEEEQDGNKPSSVASNSRH